MGLQGRSCWSTEQNKYYSEIGETIRQRKRAPHFSLVVVQIIDFLNIRGGLIMSFLIMVANGSLTSFTLTKFSELITFDNELMKAMDCITYRYVMSVVY